jgi:hypothetical protein
MNKDYPNEADLKFIEEYDLAKTGPQGLIEHLLDLWHWPEYAKYENGALELHTGGWSGNEDIIEALSKTLFWLLYWQRSERGGHYFFSVAEV